eukprot:gene5789-biopygen2782
MPAPRPRHLSQKIAYSPRHARAMPAPRPRHCPVTPETQINTAFSPRPRRPGNANKTVNIGTTSCCTNGPKPRTEPRRIAASCDGGKRSCAPGAPARLQRRGSLPAGRNNCPCVPDAPRTILFKNRMPSGHNPAASTEVLPGGLAAGVGVCRGRDRRPVGVDATATVPRRDVVCGRWQNLSH